MIPMPRGVISESRGTTGCDDLLDRPSCGTYATRVSGRCRELRPGGLKRQRKRAGAAVPFIFHDGERRCGSWESSPDERFSPGWQCAVARA